MTTPSPGRYAALDFNAPMSAALADELAESLARHQPARVVDIGCGWAELLLRVLAAAPNAHGIGVDRDEPLLARARANASARRLDGRVEFAPSIPTELDPSDVVICIGADHIFGTQAAALQALAAVTAPGGRLLFGTGFWERTPTAEEADGLGATPDELLLLPDLADLAISCGFRLLDLRTATRREWEQFELGFLADWEEWLMTWSADAAADDVRAQADAHRNGYLRGYRDVLGFAYLTLGVPRSR